MVALTSSGCSVLRTTARDLGFVRWVPHVQANGGAGKTELAQPSAKESPLTVGVHQAFFVGPRLMVKARLTPRVDLRASEVAVGVRGVRDGQVVDSSFQLLSEVSSAEWLHAERAVLVALELPADRITEYQLVCGWGEDARQLRLEMDRKTGNSNSTPPAEGSVPEEPHTPDGSRAALGNSPATVAGQVVAEQAVTDQLLSGQSVGGQSAGGQTADNRGQVDRNEEAAARRVLPEPNSGPGVSLSDVELDQQTTKCSKEPCDLRYTIRARISNSANTPVKSALFAVGVLWGSDRKLPKPPDDFQPLGPDETAAELRPMAVEPGGSKRLKIAVDRSIPQVPGGRFYPYIRIVSVSR